MFYGLIQNGISKCVLGPMYNSAVQKPPPLKEKFHTAGCVNGPIGQWQDYTLKDKKTSSDIREQLGIFNTNDKLTQYKSIGGNIYKEWMGTDYKKKKIKLQT